MKGSHLKDVSPYDGRDQRTLVAIQEPIRARQRQSSNVYLKLHYRTSVLQLFTPLTELGSFSRIICYILVLFGSVAKSQTENDTAVTVATQATRGR